MGKILLVCVMVVRLVDVGWCVLLVSIDFVFNVG